MGSSSCAASTINIIYWHRIPHPLRSHNLSSSQPSTTCLCVPCNGQRGPFRFPKSQSPASAISAYTWPTCTRPTVQLSYKAAQQIHSFLAHSILPGHVSPNFRPVDVFYSRVSSNHLCSLVEEYRRRLYPRLVHMVPHSIYGRPEVRSSAPASALTC